MNVILKIAGYFLSKSISLSYRYKQLKTNKLIGGGNRIIAFPAQISGIQNIIAEEPISIGVNSTIYTTRAKLIIKKHFVSGPNLTIITGDHHYIAGRYIDTVTDKEKLPENDQDVVIEEDVWCGANVTILKGVHIGRSSIIAAGAIVTKNIPPYCIAGGVPARVIKKKWTDEQITEHESKLGLK